MSSETKPEPHVHGPGCNHDPAPIIKQAKRVTCPGRNEPCWCGNGKKYKKCHLRADELS
ncbi:MAG: SEC-C domain-containing protein [Kofleriaceae bacterium]|nr:SEC-C domain-containing protein [Kofleriaceae bacterium]